MMMKNNEDKIRHLFKIENVTNELHSKYPLLKKKELNRIASDFENAASHLENDALPSYNGLFLQKYSLNTAKQAEELRRQAHFMRALHISRRRGNARHPHYGTIALMYSLGYNAKESHIELNKLKVEISESAIRQIWKRFKLELEECKRISEKLKKDKRDKVIQPRTQPGTLVRFSVNN